MSDEGDMLSASTINSSWPNESPVNAAGQISKETLYHAIQIWNSEAESIPAADKQRANEVLEQFQESVHAWSHADQLLDQGPDLWTRYFGAHTLRMKIQSFFHELPPDSYSALRDSLVQHVKNVTDRSEVSITNQLCLAVTYLVLQAKKWADPIGQLLNSFSPNPKYWLPLLEILIHIPEEAYSRKLHLGENRRNQVLSQLASVAHTVLDFLEKCLFYCTDGVLTPTDTNIPMLTASIFNCFKAWVQVNPQVYCKPTEIFGFSMENLETGTCSTNVHEAATDAVIEVFHHLPDPDNTDNNNVIDMHGLQQALFQSIMACEEAYRRSVAEDDLEKTLNYCRLFTEYAESKLPFMAKSPTNPHYSLRAIDLVLICEGHHDYEVAENTFQFWYKLTDVVYHLHDAPLNAMFRPYAQRCVQAMYKHCCIKADHEGPLPKDDDFYVFRTRVAELVESLAFLFGDLQIFHKIGQQVVSPTANWYSLEAALFLLRPLAKSVNMRDFVTIEPVISAVLSLTDWKHICVRISAVKFIGAMSMWFRRHSDQGSKFLRRAMAFLANSLEFQEVSNPAGAALLSMCQDCSEQIAASLDSLLGLLEQMDRFNVSNDAVVCLLRGLGHIMNTLPRDKLQTVLKQICYAQLVNLDAVPLPVHHLDAEEQGSKNDPEFWVGRLSALFRTTDIGLKEGEEHPCKNVICEDVWPVMSRVCERFQADPRIMEGVCDCLRYVVRRVGKHSHDFFQRLVTQLVQMYAAHHHSCFLHMGSILVDEYGSLDICVPRLIQMLEAFYLPTFQLLQDATGLRNHPDTVDDFFRLCVRYIQHCPVPFLSSQVFNNIVQLGLRGINLDHSEAHMSVMKFFYELVHQCREEDTDAALAGMVKNILRQYGLNSVFTCLHAAIFNLPESLLIGICDLFYQLKAYMQNDLSAWLEAGLKQLPNKTVSGAPYATLAQLEEFHKHMMDSRSVRNMRRHLQEFCRLYR